MKWKKWIVIPLLAAVLLTGCASAPDFARPEPDGPEAPAEAQAAAEPAQIEPIVVSGAVSSGAAAQSDETPIVLSDAEGSVRITEAGTYRLTGTLSDGQIVVDAPEEAKVKLILDGVSIRCEGSAAICALSADKLIVATAEGSSNLLESTGDFVQTDGTKVDACLFAKCDLNLSGDGLLGITCDSGHGVVSKDDLKIKNGTISIEAAKQGLSGKDSVTVEGGTLCIDSGTDGIHASHEDADKGGIELLGGSLTIQSGSDGVDASGSVVVDGAELTVLSVKKGLESDTDILVDSGLVSILQSSEGMEAKMITINGGDIRIVASDDGLNASGGSSSGAWDPRADNPFAVDKDAALSINSGTLIVNAEGDGLDSNGSLTVTGGEVYVSGPTRGGNGALDSGADAEIHGGVLIAAGSADMAENFGSASTQGSILLSVGNQAAGTRVSVTDENGAVLASFQPEKSYQSVVVSAPGMTVGGSYTVTAGTFSETVLLESMIYGSGMGFGGFGGGPGVPGGPGGQGGPGGPGGPGGRR